MEFIVAKEEKSIKYSDVSPQEAIEKVKRNSQEKTNGVIRKLKAKTI